MRLCCRRAIGASVIWARITRSKTGRCASRLCAGDGRRRAGHARQLARHGSPDLQGGEAAMVELLGRNLQLSAVFAYNDAMAAGAMAVLKENGITVPQHFSLIGFDDIPIARYTSPKLTTVRYSDRLDGHAGHRAGVRRSRPGGAAGRSSVHADAGAAPFCRPGKVRRRSLSDDLILCNRFQSVRKFTEY
ncbi:substrate-binding domain-containing protein [Serratia ureilytica]